MNNLFPVFLKLENLQTLIVGGGNVGLEKLEAILRNSPEANVSVVAPFIKSEIESLSNTHKKLALIHRNFEWDDLNGVDILICATDNKELHKSIYRIAKRRKILINVADTPELCDFYLGSIVNKGDLKIAISTNGKSPTFAKRLKEYLNEILVEEEINELLSNLTTFRNKLKGDFNEKIRELNKLTSLLSSKESKIIVKE